MTNRVSQLGSLTASLLALAATASADVKLNDNFSVAGYGAGSYRYLDKADWDKFDIDAAKVSFLTTFNPVSGVVSAYYRTDTDDVTLLDIYATYDFGNGSTVTAGKFLSWLGFEAFDIPNMYQISYANGDFLAPIPGYHSGIKYNYSSKAWSAGVAVLDAVYGSTAFKADGELKNNAGYEAYVSYTGIENLTLWAGIGYQTEGDVKWIDQEVTTLDFWASYQVNKQVLVAAEYVTKDSYTTDGYNWLLFLNYSIDDKFSSTFRVSGEDIDHGGPSFMKYTIAPAYKVTDNLTVRAEISYYDYKDYDLSHDTFFGLQGVFKF
jgi:Putative beta-barrel porin-2, OmpL-like. bbp2